jgi:5-methylcytosine-specific restriction endonuclease McrA
MSTIDSIVGMKTCSKCAVKKSFAEFQKNKARIDGVETYCRECNNARIQEKYASNPEYKKSKSIRKEPKTPQTLENTCSKDDCEKRTVGQGLCKNHYARAWHVKNRDYRLEKLQERLSTDPEFAVYRREVQNRSERERRARIANVTVEKITKEDYKNILASYNKCCWICELPLDKVVWDHVHPVSKGGPHIVKNLRPACSSCNVRKNSRWPFTEEMRQEVANEVRLISSRGGDA